MLLAQYCNFCLFQGLVVDQKFIHVNRAIKYIGGRKVSSKNNYFVPWIVVSAPFSSTPCNIYPIVVDVDSFFLIWTNEIQDSMEPAARSLYRGAKRPIGQDNAITKISWLIIRVRVITCLLIKVSQHEKKYISDQQQWRIQDISHGGGCASPQGGGTNLLFGQIFP